MLKKIFMLTGLMFGIVLGYPKETIIHINDGEEIVLIAKSAHGSAPKTQTISASIIGHTLTVAFSKNLGEVSIEISTASGATICCLSVQTPTGYQYYIPSSGNYVVTFTLQNGDEYLGEFVVSE